MTKVCNEDSVYQWDNDCKEEAEPSTFKKVI